MSLENHQNNTYSCDGDHTSSLHSQLDWTLEKQVHYSMGHIPGTNFYEEVTDQTRKAPYMSTILCTADDLYIFPNRLPCAAFPPACNSETVEKV